MRTVGPETAACSSVWRVTRRIFLSLSHLVFVLSLRKREGATDWAGLMRSPLPLCCLLLGFRPLASLVFATNAADNNSLFFFFLCLFFFFFILLPERRLCTLSLILVRKFCIVVIVFFLFFSFITVLFSLGEFVIIHCVWLYRGSTLAWIFFLFIIIILFYHCICSFYVNFFCNLPRANSEGYWKPVEVLYCSCVFFYFFNDDFLIFISAFMAQK